MQCNTVGTFAVFTFEAHDNAVMRIVCEVCSTERRCLKGVSDKPAVCRILNHVREAVVDLRTIAVYARSQLTVPSRDTRYNHDTLLGSTFCVHGVVIILCKECDFGHILTREVKRYVIVHIIIAVDCVIGLIYVTAIVLTNRIACAITKATLTQRNLITAYRCIVSRRHSRHTKRVNNCRHGCIFIDGVGLIQHRRRTEIAVSYDRTLTELVSCLTCICPTICEEIVGVDFFKFNNLPFVQIIQEIGKLNCLIRCIVTGLHTHDDSVLFTIHKVCSTNRRIANVAMQQYPLAIVVLRGIVNHVRTPHAKTLTVEYGRTICRIFRKQSAIGPSQTCCYNDTVFRSVAIEYGFIVIICKECKHRHVLTREVSHEVIVEAIVAVISKECLICGIRLIRRIAIARIICAIAQITARQNNSLIQHVIIGIDCRAATKRYTVNGHISQILYVTLCSFPLCINIARFRNRRSVAAPTCKDVPISNGICRCRRVCAISHKVLFNQSIPVVIAYNVTVQFRPCVL